MHGRQVVHRLNDMLVAKRQRRGEESGELFRAGLENPSVPSARQEQLGIYYLDMQP